MSMLLQDEPNRHWQMQKFESRLAYKFFSADG